MKPAPTLLAALLLAPLDALHTAAAGKYEAPQMEIDWPSFLAKQDPVWGQLPRESDDSAQVGNGVVGLSVYQDGDANVVRFDVGRTDVADNRPFPIVSPQFGRCRLPIWHFKLHTVGKISGGTLCTGLWNAEVRGGATYPGYEPNPPFELHEEEGVALREKTASIPCARHRPRTWMRLSPATASGGTRTTRRASSACRQGGWRTSTGCNTATRWTRNCSRASTPYCGARSTTTGMS